MELVLNNSNILACAEREQRYWIILYFLKVRC